MTLVVHECPLHGRLCAAPASAEVYCRKCRKWLRRPHSASDGKSGRKASK